MTRGERFLIVNADDFGQSPGINRGIIQAHERGIVTSASLMVRWPAAAEAARYCASRPELDVGLHIDLCEWACRNGEWASLYRVVDLDEADAVEAEIDRQLAEFRRLMGREPTHLDSHQHVHRSQPVHDLMRALADRLGVPLRHYAPGIQYCGSFYGQTAGGSPVDGVSVDHLLELLRGLAEGLTELGCHPGLDHDVDSMYRQERSQEVEVLCDTRIREALASERIVLRSFADSVVNAYPLPTS